MRVPERAIAPAPGSARQVNAGLEPAFCVQERAKRYQVIAVGTRSGRANR